jgi:tellurite resistance protein
MTDGGLTPEEAEVFARGLYFLATQDGIEAREEALIKEFLRESKAPVDWDALAKSAFSPLEAAQVLETTYLRRIFLKLAVALVKADGSYSDRERRALGEIADAFGIDNAEFGDLEQAAGRSNLE